MMNHRFRSYTKRWRPCGLQVESFQGCVGFGWTPGLLFGDRAQGSGTRGGGNCCITTELIYLWPAN